MAGDNTLTFTDAGFDSDVLKSDKPVLVDFWAEWCGPCRMMTPAIDSVATDYSGRAKVGKLNVDDNGQTAMRYQIRGIPALLLFKDGKVVDQRVGAVGKSELQKMLDAHVSAPGSEPVSAPASAPVTVPLTK
jgi:thioredoxin 1